MAISVTGDLTSGSTTVASVSPDTAALVAGMEVSGTGIPVGATIASITDGSNFELSVAATATGAGVSINAVSLFEADGTAEATVDADLSTATVEMEASGTVSATGTADLYAPVDVEMEASGTVSATGTADLYAPVDVEMEASGTVSATGTAATLSGAVVLAGEGTASATGNADLYFPVAVEMGASGTASATGTASMGMSLFVEAEAACSASGSGTISMLTPLPDALGTAVAEGMMARLDTVLALAAKDDRATATGLLADLSVEGYGLTVKDAILDLGQMLGFTPSCTGLRVPDFAQRLGINALNAALQDLFSLADDLDYYQLETWDVVFPAGTSMRVLGREVQNVTGDVYSASSGKSLAGTKSREDFAHFADWYLDGSPTEPVAFHVDREKQGSTDSVLVTLRVTPTPVSDWTAKVEVAVEPTRYTWSDYGFETPLQVPHRYSESVLLPIARHHLLHSSQVVESVDRDQVRSDYRRAMMILGKVDPIPEEEVKPEEAVA